MPALWVKNREALATTPLRAQALDILEAGYNAIDTKTVIQNSFHVTDGHFKVDGLTFAFSAHKRIRIIGFGKASFEAATALEGLLGSKINDGVVIDINVSKGQYFRSFKGTHPRPSAENVSASQAIIELTRDVREDDLFIVIVSGGGSALLCWPKEECDQGQVLYEEFLKVGANIHELNTVRKHLSMLKGGGLARFLYPATVLGLIFCDVPGDHQHDVASGPTYRDKSTVRDAKKILKHFKLEGRFALSETPKERRYFKKVHNVALVSNRHALDLMAKKAKELGFKPRIISTELSDFSEVVLKKMMSKAKPGTAILAGGEPRVIVPTDKGSGGRNLYMGLQAVKNLENGDLFISFASDGLDNGPSAGAIVDDLTKERVAGMKLDLEGAIRNADAYPLFQTIGDLITTGFTGANVSDLMMLLRPKK